MCVCVCFEREFVNPGQGGGVRNRLFHEMRESRDPKGGGTKNVSPPDLVVAFLSPVHFRGLVRDSSILMSLVSSLSTRPVFRLLFF